MDSHTTLQQYIFMISSELSDTENLNPNQMIAKIQRITNSGFQPHIIQTIRNCIQHTQKDRAIIKYAHIVDKLLKVPGWNQMIQKVIVQFFSDIFIFLLIQKCFNQIDELKIIRKFWLKTIHPKLHQTMRDFILAETKIDIDQYFKPQAIGLLKTHYENKLKLSAEQMKFHLPRTIKTSNTIYQCHLNKTQSESFSPVKQFPISHHNPNPNANYYISQPIRLPPYVLNPSLNVNIMRNQPEPMARYPTPSYNEPYILNRPTNHYQNTHRQTIQNDPYHIAVPFPQRISPSPDPRDPRTNIQRPYIYNQKIVQQRENIPFYPERTEYYNENYKRERFYSEQTRTPNSSEYMMNQTQVYPPQVNASNQYEVYEKIEMISPQPQKKVHLNEDYTNSVEIQQKKEKRQYKEKEEQKPGYKKILQMLGSDKIYKCKQCGKGYKSMAEYQKHTSQHFEDRMGLRQKRKVSHKLMSFDEWTQRGSSASLQQFEQFYITLSNLCREQKRNIQPLQLKCRLCSEAFDLKFFSDQWTLSNATYCQIDGKLVPMHKSCQRALDDSSQEGF